MAPFKNFQFKLLIFINIFFLLVLTSAGWANKFYVDWTNGNDSNDGTSPAEAWKTIDKINTTSFSPGDSILFRRGDIWREQLTVPSSGSNGNPIVFGAYGSGKNPIISGAEELRSWTSAGGTAYWKPVESITRVVFYDGRLLKEKNGATSNVGLDEWDWKLNKLYVNVGEDPDNGSLEAGQRDYAICDDGGPRGYIVIENLEIHGANKSWGGAIDFRRDGGPVTVRNCTIKLNNSNGIMMLNDDAIISNNTITLCEDNAIHVHEYCTNSILSENLITYCHQGIELLGDNNIIEKNHIHHSEYNGLFIEGRPYHEPLGWTGSSADYNIIRYNTFHDNGQGPLADITAGAELCNAGGDHNQIYYNLFYNGSPHSAVGIWFDFWVSYNDVYNNVIYNMKSPQQGYGITIETAINPPPQYPHPNLHGQKTEFNVIKNNIISDCRVLLALADDWETMHDHTFDNNCYYVGSGDYAVYDGRIINFRSFEEWQASQGNPDSNSIALNPNLINPAGGDFHLNTNSPCIDSGATVSLIIDFDGNLVPFGGGVDIGAFEWFDPNLNRPQPPQNLKVRLKN